MARADTSIGGDGNRFPATTQGILASLRQPVSQTPSAGLEVLCRRYWKPVYRYVRTVWAKSNEDAKDLTQAFFAWLLEGNPLNRYDPALGGFRPFLKIMLQRFIGHQHAALRRLKRGGGALVLSLDEDLSPLSESLPDSRATDPETVFDRAWFKELLAQTLTQVKEAFLSRGDTLTFRVYEDYELRPEPERPTYKDLAARLNLSERDIKSRLFAAREEIRLTLRSTLSQLTVSDQELREEWNGLLGG